MPWIPSKRAPDAYIGLLKLKETGIVIEALWALMQMYSINYKPNLISNLIALILPMSFVTGLGSRKQRDWKIRDRILVQVAAFGFNPLQPAPCHLPFPDPILPLPSYDLPTALPGLERPKWAVVQETAQAISVGGSLVSAAACT